MSTSGRDSDLLAATCQRIDRAHDALGHSLGWRFLTSPARTLHPETEIALITLNPGGDRDRPEQPRESVEAGSAYVLERWKKGCAPGASPLQIQIRALFSRLAELRSLEIDGDALLEQSLTAQFIPFRSKEYATLTNQQESLAFAGALWSDLLGVLSPRLVVCIDRDTSKALVRILSNRWGRAASERTFPTGWGNFKADVVSWKNENGRHAMLRLPHLSTFKLFSRDACAHHVDAILRSAIVAGWGDDDPIRQND